MNYERKIKITYGIEDIYEYYKSNSDNPIDNKLFKTIIYELNRTISDMIIKDSFEYRIPHGLGFLRIKKKKLKYIIRENRIDINKNIINWEETWKYWNSIYKVSRKEIKDIKNKKVIFQENEHTNGEVMRWYWDKRTVSCKNISAYSFKVVKGGEYENKLYGRLGLSKWIKSEEKDNDYYY